MFWSFGFDTRQDKKDNIFVAPPAMQNTATPGHLRELERGEEKASQLGTQQSHGQQQTTSESREEKADQLAGLSPNAHTVSPRG